MPDKKRVEIVYQLQERMKHSLKMKPRSAYKDNWFPCVYVPKVIVQELVGTTQVADTFTMRVTYEVENHV